MHKLKQYVRVPLNLALAFVVILTACSPTTYAKWAQKAGDFAVKTKPIFVELNRPDIIARIDQIDRDTDLLADALKLGDNASILDKTAAVINGLDVLFNTDLALIKDPAKRAKVDKWLTVAQIAVGVIVEAFPEVNSHHALTQEQKAALDTIKKFKRNVRCRASGPIELNGRKYKAGQFVPMRACDKFPDNTQVERLKR